MTEHQIQKRKKASKVGERILSNWIQYPGSLGAKKRTTKWTLPNRCGALLKAFDNKAEHAVQSNAAGKGCIILSRSADQC